jgi:DNA-binding PadR family transcriptional regulator
MKDLIFITLTEEQKEHLTETTQMITALVEAIADGKEVILPIEEEQELKNVIAAVLEYAQAIFED